MIDDLYVPLLRPPNLLVDTLPDALSSETAAKDLLVDTLPDALSSETAAKELYFRVVASDLFMCSDLIDGNDLVSYQFQKTYRQSGDKIFCENIDGGASWGVRLGNSQNPIIPLHPGRTINKRFRYFTLYSTDPAPVNSGGNLDGGGVLQETVIEIYTSVGEPLITDSPKEFGKGFGSRTTGRTNCVATTTSRLIMADYNNPFGVAQLKPGRRGATLMLRNVDLSNTLFLAQQSSTIVFPVQKTEMFRILPGETITLDLDGSIQQSFSQTRFIGSPNVGLVIYTKAGTCLYDWMISRMDFDGASLHPEANVGLNLG